MYPARKVCGRRRNGPLVAHLLLHGADAQYRCVGLHHQRHPVAHRRIYRRMEVRHQDHILHLHTLVSDVHLAGDIYAARRYDYGYIQARQPSALDHHRRHLLGCRRSDVLLAGRLDGRCRYRGDDYQQLSHGVVRQNRSRNRLGHHRRSHSVARFGEYRHRRCYLRFCDDRRTQLYGRYADDR